MQVDIAAPVEEVFEYVADFDNALNYMAHFQTFRPLSPHSYGLGAKVRASGRLHGIPVSTDLQIVEFQKNRRLASVSRKGIQSFSRWAFEPHNGGTRVTFTARYELSGLPVAGRVLSKLLEDSIRSGTRQTLERLKRQLESRHNGHEVEARENDLSDRRKDQGTQEQSKAG